MNKTKISWTGQTANPIRARHRRNGKRGWYCVKTSPGCAHCYSERINLGPYGNGLHFLPSDGVAAELYLEEKVLHKLERQRKSAKCFLCDMTDIFLENAPLSLLPTVPVEWIARIWATMAVTPHITYQILTKRAQRMHRLLDDPAFPEMVSAVLKDRAAQEGWCIDELETYPLPNVWLGVSVENQYYADRRIPLLLQTPAAVRFLSCEPLLGEIDLGDMVGGDCCFERREFGRCHCAFKGVDWIICGGESGPHFRPIHLDWARSLRDQCVSAGVPFWYKQGSGARSEMEPLLDGVEWHQFPK